MNIVGSILTLISALCYSFRYSFTKDLGTHHISKEFLMFIQRAISLPFIIIIVLIAKENIFLVSNTFLIWLLILLILGVFFNFLQIFVYQKHNFSSVEGLSFLNIIFTTIGGVIFFHEILSTKHLIGVGLMTLSCLILTLIELKKTKFHLNILEVIFYFLFASVIDITQKQGVLVSSPLIFTLYLTSGLAIISFLMTKINNKIDAYDWKNNETNKLLLLTGLVTAVSFIGINFGYKLLPIGVVSAIVSLRIFFSLWLSHKKYLEKDLWPKVITSGIAFVGVLILFL